MDNYIALLYEDIRFNLHVGLRFLMKTLSYLQLTSNEKFETNWSKKPLVLRPTMSENKQMQSKFKPGAL